MIGVEVIGTGSYLPGDPITNEQIAALFGRQVIWLSEMFGANCRHFAIDLNTLKLLPGETNANMATKAAQRALLNADMDPASIDLIVMATSTPDYPFPATALFVQEKLGISDCSVIELRAGCGGMAQAFLIAKSLITSGVSRKALLIGSDLISPFMQLFTMKNEELSKDYLVSLSMFGDGAGALVLSACFEKEGVLDCFSSSLSMGRAPGMILHTGGALHPVGYGSDSIHGPSSIFQHDFKAIFEHGPELIQATKKWLQDEKGYDLSTIDYFIPPQVNMRLINLVAAQMMVQPEKVYTNFGQVGNTVSASIYIALDQMNKGGLLHQGDLLALLPTEATKWVYGAVILRWTKQEGSG